MEIIDPLILMLINFILYKYIQPAIYFIIIIIIIMALNERESPLIILEKFIFFVSIPVFLTLVIFIFTSNGIDFFLSVIFNIPKEVKNDGFLKVFLETSVLLSWLLCASVVPLRILFNKLKINIKIGSILYIINFIIYISVIISSSYGYIKFP